MRIAAFSDVHGNITALEAVVADMRRQQPDMTIFLGDLSGRGPRPAECIALLRSLNPQYLIQGNQEENLGVSDWVPRSIKEEIDLAHQQYHHRLVSEADRVWLLQLPTKASVTLAGVPTDLFHATPWDLYHTTWPWASDEDLARLCLDPSAKLVLFGHGHRPFIRHVQGRMIVNTGSVGMPFDGDNRASYAVIDIEGGNTAAQIRRVAYDVEKAAALATGMPYPEIFQMAVRTGSYPFQPHQTARRV